MNLKAVSAFLATLATFSHKHPLYACARMRVRVRECAPAYAGGVCFKVARMARNSKKAW